MRRYSNPNVRAGNVLSIKTSTSAPPALARHVNCRELYIHKTWTQETGTHIIRLSVENVRHPTRGSILHEMTIQNDLNEPTVYWNCGQYHPIQSETILKIVRHALTRIFRWQKSVEYRSLKLAYEEIYWCISDEEMTQEAQIRFISRLTVVGWG